LHAKWIAQENTVSILNIINKKHTSYLLQLIEVAKDTRLSRLLASYLANEMAEVQF